MAASLFIVLFKTSAYRSYFTTEICVPLIKLNQRGQYYYEYTYR